MKRRVAFVLSFVLAIILCVPSVHVYADGGFPLAFGTDDCYDLISFEDSVKAERGRFNNSNVNCIYSEDNSFFNFGESTISSFLDISSFEFDISNSVWVLSKDLSANTLYINAIDLTNINVSYSSISCPTAADYNLGILFDSDPGVTTLPSYRYKFVISTGTWSKVSGPSNLNISHSLYRIYESGTSTHKLYLETVTSPDTYYFGKQCIGSFIWGNVDHVYSPYYEASQYTYYVSSTSTTNSLYNAFPKVCFNESNKSVQIHENFEDSAPLITVDFVGEDYFRGGSVPYYDGVSIVEPPSEDIQESNLNHLYLTGCDSGFTKPLSLNNLNSSGGGYVYFTYNFDDWINNHSGDYTLQCNSTFYINNSSTGTIVRRNLDISGVAIYALSELGDFVDWQNLNTTFMGYPNQVLTGNYIKGYVYSLTYNQFGILQERYAKAGAHTVGYWVVKFANMLPGVKITENNVNYQEYFNSVVPSRFDLKVSFKIIDNVSGEESGTYTKTFNMLTGVSNVDSNSIQDNNNPYEPTNTDDIQLPSIVDNGNGYLIETGDNNQIVNLTTPDNIKLFIDNGFQNFLAWYETSSDTAYATNRFWSSMGIFEGNPATELYYEYFGFLPDDFKTLIFSCAGIGIVGGAFCILRRRLH